MTFSLSEACPLQALCVPLDRMQRMFSAPSQPRAGQGRAGGERGGRKRSGGQAGEGLREEGSADGRPMRTGPPTLGRTRVNRHRVVLRSWDSSQASGGRSSPCARVVSAAPRPCPVPEALPLAVLPQVRKAQPSCLGLEAVGPWLQESGALPGGSGALVRGQAARRAQGRASP